MKWIRPAQFASSRSRAGSGSPRRSVCAPGLMFAPCTTDHLKEPTMHPLRSLLSRCWRTIHSAIGHAGAPEGKARRYRPGLELLEDRTVPSQGLSDVLYIADLGDHTVKQFDATTGAYLGTFVTPGSGGLVQPVGIDFGPDHNLLVGNLGASANSS